jgi:site-specific DNA-methyltransferase (adenine-specific)
MKVPLKVARNARQKMDGLALLGALEDRTAALVVFDPEYRQALDRLQFGNEGDRQSDRAELPQMDDAMIGKFVAEIQRVLRSSGHLALFVDKYAIVSGSWQKWLPEIFPMRTVDCQIWDKGRIGMGRRFRSRWEAMIVIQKGPVRAEGIWKNRGIPDICSAKADKSRHPHAKPVPMLQALIECVTEPGDIVVDPAAGGYSTLDACRATGRTFIGCDLL